ncbi:hypothetical protein ACFL6G_06320 [candidate division KSB1 bacterium]
MVNKVIKISIIQFFLIPVLFFSVSAQTENELFIEGNRFYQSEMYIQALEKYTEILDSGYETGELYYNIGNTYYKLGELGKTVLFYEKARRLIPEDEDLLTNIQLVNDQLVDKITPIPDVFYVSFWNKFRNSISLKWWRTIFFISLWFIALCVSFLFFVRRQFIRKLLKNSLAVIGFVAIMITLVLISHSIMDRPGQDGVIMDKEVRVFASPTESGTELFIIHEGTRIHIKRELEGWLEVDLADGKVGWIPAEVIEII